MSIYADIILDHYQHPRNNKKISHTKSTSEVVSVDVDNSLCGDTLHMEIAFSEGKITDIGFTGEGCAISIAAASMLTEYAKGKKRDDLVDMKHEDVLGLLGIELTPNRMKCALLSWEALKKLLIIHY